MTAGIIAINIVPLHTFAIEKKGNTTISQKGIHNDSSQHFQNVTLTVASDIADVDYYAEAILNQSEINFHNISLIKNGFKRILLNNQQIRKKNASHWLNSLKNDINKTKQTIMDYNDTFQKDYEGLLIAVKQKDKKRLKIGLRTMQLNIIENKDKTQLLLDELTSFRDDMLGDRRNIEKDTKKLKSILDSETQYISVLQQKINSYNNSIKTWNDNIESLKKVPCHQPSAAIGCSIIFSENQKKITIAEQEIKKLNENINDRNQEIREIEKRSRPIVRGVDILTDTQDNATNMLSKIDITIDSIQDIINQWHKIISQYEEVLQNIENIDFETHYIKARLDTVKDSWDDLKDFVDNLYQ